MVKKTYSKITKCPVTGENDKITYFDLGDIPLVNNLLDTREESLNCERYPLKVNYFPSGQSALSHAVDSDLLFKNYLFKSGVNTPYINHCKDMFKKELNNLPEGSIIVDIGGNDGTLLDAFRSVNMKQATYCNIDPSENLTELSKEKNIDTINEFFTHKLAKKLKFKADCIVSTNVFQHLKDINDFAAGVDELLNDEGLWILEFPYWMNSMKTNQFDQVYHEHMYYHSVTPLQNLFKKHNLEINGVEFKTMHGGSLRLKISKIGIAPINTSVQEYIANEKNYDLNYHIEWGRNIQQHILTCKDELNKLIFDGNSTIAGFGAAAKGCIFLNAMGFDWRWIPWVIDDTDVKQGKYIPGTGIKIVDRGLIKYLDKKNEEIDYILILAHNWKDTIMSSLKRDGYKGKFITLVPKFKIYG